MQQSPQQVTTPPRDEGHSSTGLASLEQSPYPLDIDRQAGLVTSMVNHFEAPRQDVCKGFELCSPTNVCVRPPADSDCSSEDCLEMGSMPLQASDSASSLPLLPLRIPRSFDDGTSDPGTRSDSSYVLPRSRSSDALDHEQEVRKLRRRLLDNLKARQQQCLRTVTPLKQIEHITCMPRSMSEQSMGWQERALCISGGQQASASYLHLMEQLLAANLARDEALEEAKQLRKEQFAIRTTLVNSLSSKSKTVPLRRFSMLTLMMVVMLAVPLPIGLKRWKRNPSSQACKSFSGMPLVKKVLG